MEKEKLIEAIRKNRKILLAFGLFLGGVLLFSMFPSSGEKIPEMNWDLSEEIENDSIHYFPEKENKIIYSSQFDFSLEENSANELDELEELINSFEDDKEEKEEPIPTTNLYQNSSAWEIEIPEEKPVEIESVVEAVEEVIEEAPNAIDVLEERKKRLQTGRVNTEDDKTIKIAINGTQKVKNGQRATFRMLQDAFIEGQLIKKNTLISGICKFEDFRIQIKITSIRNSRDIIFTDFDVYGMDGLAGIPIESDRSLENVKDRAQDELANETSTKGRIGRILAESVRSSNNNIEVTLINNHNLILVR